MERARPIRRLTRSKASGSDTAATKLWSNPPLLTGERLEDFEGLHDVFTREIHPRGIIEEMYVNDVTWLVWEIIRLRRCRADIIKANYLGGLQDLLSDLIKEPGEFARSVQDNAQELSLKWFASNRGKEEVRKILKCYDLGDTAIEAAAVRRCLPEFEVLERLMSALEVRRDRALASIAAYRQSFANKLRESADRLITTESNKIPRYRDASVVTSPE